MKSYFLGLIILLGVGICYALLSKSPEPKRPEPILVSEVHERAAPQEKIVKPEIVIPKEEATPIRKNIPEASFYDWSEDEIINDSLLDTWGQNIFQAFFDERDNKNLLEYSKNLSDQNEFITNWPDLQPFIISLKKEKSRLKAYWISYRKATGGDGNPHPVWNNNLDSEIPKDPYKNMISLSEYALGPIFLGYFGGQHNCKQGVMIVSSKKFNADKVDGDFFCRSGVDEFVLMGLFSLSYVGSEI